MRHEVLYYQASSGRSPIEEFLDGIPVKAAAKCATDIANHTRIASLTERRLQLAALDQTTSSLQQNCFGQFQIAVVGNLQVHIFVDDKNDFPA